MNVFRQHSALVRVGHDEGRGLATVVYSGPTSPSAFGELRKLVVPAVAGSGALLVDVRGMLLLGTVVSVDAGAFVGDESPPAAIIAPVESIDIWKGYADDAAMRGIIRAVFIDPRLALEWASLWIGPAGAHLAHLPVPALPRMPGS